MYDTVIVHVFEADDAACYEEFSLLLGEFFPLVVMVAEVATCNQISHEEQILIILERVEHVYQESKNGKVLFSNEIE